MTRACGDDQAAQAPGRRLADKFDHFIHMLGLKRAVQASAPAAALLGFIVSFMIPPFSEGSNYDSREAGIAGDAPLMWTNIHSGDIILDTKIRDWVRLEGMIDANISFNIFESSI